MSYYLEENLRLQQKLLEYERIIYDKAGFNDFQREKFREQEQMIADLNNKLYESKKKESEYLAAYENLENQYLLVCKKSGVSDMNVTIRQQMMTERANKESECNKLVSTLMLENAELKRSIAITEAKNAELEIHIHELKEQIGDLSVDSMQKDAYYSKISSKKEKLSYSMQKMQEELDKERNKNEKTRYSIPISSNDDIQLIISRRLKKKSIVFNQTIEKTMNNIMEVMSNLEEKTLAAFNLVSVIAQSKLQSERDIFIYQIERQLNIIDVIKGTIAEGLEITKLPSAYELFNKEEQLFEMIRKMKSRFERICFHK